jgi:ABC-type transport system substrate-binding protein
VLRWGLDLSSAAAGPITFDPPAAQAAASQEAWQLPVYDSLLRPSPNGSFVPGLALSATIVDPETLSVRLRPGVRFSDGTAFDASAVRAGILRNEQAPNHGQFRAQLYDVVSIDVATPTTLTIHLSQPVAAAFYGLLASPETYIVSPKAAASSTADLAKSPVGAGPFLLKQYTPGGNIVLVKNPRYFAARSVRLREIDIVNVPTGPQDVNALEAGQVDLASVALSAVPAVRGGPFHVQEVQTVGSMLWVPVCKTSAPLSDVRVRQALNFGIDRRAIDHALLQGVGEPQWALWPSSSPLAPPSLKGVYAYNPAKARQLLAAAGYGGGLTLSILGLPGIPLVQQTEQVLQQQWKRIGVNLTVDSTADFVNDLYQRRVAPLGLVTEMPAGSNGLDMVNRLFVPGAIGDLCDYDNPGLDHVAAQLNASAPGTSQNRALWMQAQQMIVGQALAVLNALPIVEVSSTRVAGNTMLQSSFYPLLNYWTAYVK